MFDKINKTIIIMILIFVLVTAKIIIIWHKYIRLTHFRDHLKSSLRKVPFPVKLGTLPKKTQPCPLGAIPTMPVFLLDWNNSSNDKLLSKVGQLYRLPYQCCIFLFGFRIWQKSYSSTSRVILKDSFYKIFFHYGSRKIFVEFTHQFLNIFYMNSSIVTFGSM